MDDRVRRLRTVDRETLLHFLAHAIHEVTTEARSRFHDAGTPYDLQEPNEVIRRLSAHLRDLCDHDEPLTDGRAKGIVAAIDVLRPLTASGPEPSPASAVRSDASGAPDTGDEPA